ncbi:MAG: hypothetical protein WCI74_07445 [Actinomycetes bacterium]
MRLTIECDLCTWTKTVSSEAEADNWAAAHYMRYHSPGASLTNPYATRLTLVTDPNAPDDVL